MTKDEQTIDTLRRENTALIDAITALLAEVRRLRCELAACQERERKLFISLAAYGSHHRNCSHWDSINSDCDCGYLAALSDKLAQPTGREGE